MKSDELSYLESLANNATAGPWNAVTDYSGWDGDPDTVGGEYPTLVLGADWHTPEVKADHPADCHEADGGPGPFICTTGVNPQDGAPDEDVPNAESNAAFIAAARKAVPALIAAVREAQAALPQWINAGERLPSDCRLCPVAFFEPRTGKYALYGDAYYSDRTKQWMDDTTVDEKASACSRKVVLWLDQPMPALPETPAGTPA